MTLGGTRLALLLVPCVNGYVIRDGWFILLGTGNLGTRLLPVLLNMSLGMDSSFFVGTNLCTMLLGSVSLAPGSVPPNSDSGWARRLG